MRRLLISLVFLVFVIFGASNTIPAQDLNPPVTSSDNAPPLRILGRDVDEWIAHLKQTEQAEERKLAMFCLAEFGPTAVAAVPELLAVSKDELQPENQRWAAWTLGAIGSAAKSALPHLLAQLNNSALPSPYRVAACGALPQIDPKDARVRKAVLAAMRDRNADVRAEAITATVILAPLDSVVVAALSKALLIAEDAQAAATALLCIGDVGIEIMVKSLERGGNATRATIAEAIGCLGRDAIGTLPALLRSLKRERDPKVCLTMILAVARIGPKDPTTLLALVERLILEEPRSEGKRDEELFALSTRVLTAAGQAALPALENALRARAVHARLVAVNVLSKLPASVEIIQNLVARAQDQNVVVQLAALKALDAYGPAAAQAREALSIIAKNEVVDVNVKHAAQLAALNVARQPGSPRYKTTLEAKTNEELLTRLRDRAPATRQEAAEALRNRIDDTGAVATALIDALDDLDEHVRIAATRSLVRFGKFSRVALPKLSEWLESECQALRQAALIALTGMGPDARPALPMIVAAAISPSVENDVELRKFLAIVLRAIGPDAATPLLAELKSDDPKVRVRAARALGSMQIVAAPAVPELIELCQSTVDTDAQAGFAALADMGPFVYPLVGEHLVRTIRGDLFAERRKWAAWAAGEIKAPATGDRFKLIDALLLALLDEEEGVCRGAHSSLVRIGEPALPKLRDMLKLGEGEAPYWAVRVMARMKADPQDVIPRLIELTQPGKRPVERGTAIELLGEYAPNHPEMIPMLLRALGDREDYVARLAISSLALFGEQVTNQLKLLLKSRNSLLRQRALEALAAVRAKLEQ
ncbi:MAG: HEAT repeat domain-containing protein [Planctomycetota bacterium]